MDTKASNMDAQQAGSGLAGQTDPRATATSHPGNLGPLAQLIGVWEGRGGTDVSPGVPDRMRTDTELSYRERWALELVSPRVENHDQRPAQLTFATNAWRADTSSVYKPEDKKGGEAFHAQVGYLIWDPETNQVTCPFAVPRGIVINAGGIVSADATTFDLLAEAGSDTYGICQQPYLLEQFKVVRYILKIKVNGDGTIDYEQDTQLEIKGRGLMHHTDANHLTRIS